MDGIKHIEHPNWTIYPELGIIKNDKTQKLVGCISTSTGYVVIHHSKIHRLIYEAVNNIKLTKIQHINHINRIKTDNRIENLEIVSNQQNSQWSIHRTGNYKGVSWNKAKNMWRAELKYNYKNIFLGYHINEIDGAKAYNDYAMYLNETDNCKYLLNNIENYNTVARNKDEVKLFHKRV
jgi:hypothetical protein